MNCEAAPIPKRALLVSFSGIDGAGKSTQIEVLTSRLRGAGLRVQILPFWDEVAVFTRYRDGASHRLFGSERGIGAPGSPVNRRDKNVQSWYMTSFRFLLYALDALSLAWSIGRLQQGPPDVVIFDRYLYDELANLPWANPVVRIYARALLGLVPAPDIAYVLDADPEQARARKPEYPVEFLQRSREGYLNVGSLGNLTVIPVGTVLEVAEAILQSFLATLDPSTPDLPPPEDFEDCTPPEPVAVEEGERRGHNPQSYAPV